MFDFINTFADHHSFIAFFAMILIVEGVVNFFLWPFRIAKRLIRSRDIRARGWPTAPVDADGDVILPKKED